MNKGKWRKRTLASISASRLRWYCDRSVKRRSLIILRSCSVSSVPYLHQSAEALHYYPLIHTTTNLYFFFHTEAKSTTLIRYDLISGLHCWGLIYFRPNLPFSLGPWMHVFRVEQPDWLVKYHCSYWLTMVTDRLMLGLCIFWKFSALIKLLICYEYDTWK